MHVLYICIRLSVFMYDSSNSFKHCIKWSHLSKCHFDLLFNLSKGKVHDFSGEVQKISGEVQNDLWGWCAPTHTSLKIRPRIRLDKVQVRLRVRFGISSILVSSLNTPGKKSDFGILSNFCLGKKLRNIFNFTHMLWENFKESLYRTVLSVDFKIVKCCSIFKFGIMYRQIFRSCNALLMII
jgi:hypothetical protein